MASTRALNAGDQHDDANDARRKSRDAKFEMGFVSLSESACSS